MTFPIPDTAIDDRLGILGTAGSFRDGLIREREQLIEPSKLDCAYAAGFFDGDGCISIARVDRSDCVDPTYALVVIAAQVEIAPLLFIQNRWGGSMGEKAAKPPRQAYFDWRTQAGTASDFLFDLVEHLTVKRERAILGMRFQAVKQGQGQFRGNRERAPILEQFYAEMRAMNGYPPNPWKRREPRQ